MTGESSSQ
jgi:hypothetical protein